jgi:hypothetical protein
MPLLRRLIISQDLNIQYIRCDNAPENRMLQQACYEDPKLIINFEYTAPGTPQNNGNIERKFATLNGKCRAMLNAAKGHSTQNVGTLCRFRDIIRQCAYLEGC